MLAQFVLPQFSQKKIIIKICYYIIFEKYIKNLILNCFNNFFTEQTLIQKLKKLKKQIF